MNLAPVIARLAAQCPLFREVAGAAEADAAMQAGTPNAPTAYVVQAAETGGDNYLVGPSAQRVESYFTVLIVVRTAAGSARGEQAQADLEVHRVAVRDALLGWQDASAMGEPCLFAEGRLADWKPGGILWWADTWRTAFDIRSA